jgi:hypothetical protein
LDTKKTKKEKTMKMTPMLLAIAMFALTVLRAEAAPGTAVASISVAELKKKTAIEQSQLVLDAVAQTYRELLSKLSSDGKSKSREQIEDAAKMAGCMADVFWPDRGETISTAAFAEFAETLEFKAKASPDMTLRETIKLFVRWHCDVDHNKARPYPQPTKR